MAILILTGGVLAKLVGPLHLDIVQPPYSRGPSLISSTVKF
ncbi:hypothetical protein [Spirosoma oryzicola]|nr:hypothetical protein [Spirosoma oryzicola]